MFSSPSPCTPLLVPVGPFDSWAMVEMGWMGLLATQASAALASIQPTFHRFLNVRLHQAL